MCPSRASSAGTAVVATACLGVSFGIAGCGATTAADPEASVATASSAPSATLDVVNGALKSPASFAEGDFYLTPPDGSPSITSEAAAKAFATTEVESAEAATAKSSSVFLADWTDFSSVQPSAGAAPAAPSELVWVVYFQDAAIAANGPAGVAGHPVSSAPTSDEDILAFVDAKTGVLLKVVVTMPDEAAVDRATIVPSAVSRPSAGQ